jgi:hypothetical protein
MHVRARFSANWRPIVSDGHIVKTCIAVELNSAGMLYFFLIKDSRVSFRSRFIFIATTPLPSLLTCEFGTCAPLKVKVYPQLLEVASFSAFRALEWFPHGRGVSNNPLACGGRLSRMTAKLGLEVSVTDGSTSRVGKELTRMPLTASLPTGLYRCFPGLRYI